MKQKARKPLKGKVILQMILLSFFFKENFFYMHQNQVQNPYMILAQRQMLHILHDTTNDPTPSPPKTTNSCCSIL